MKRRPTKRFTALSGRYLKQQRKRTLLTIAAVVLSVALITSAGVFAQSIRLLGVENVRARFGGFYAQVLGASDSERATLESHLVTDVVGSTIVVGPAPVTDDLSMFVQAPDATWIDAMGYSLAAGSFPTEPGEIAVEAWLFTAVSRPTDIGSSITLPLGETGDPLTMTVVGFLSPSSGARSRGVASALISQEEARAIVGSSATYRVGFTTVKGMPPQEGIEHIASSFGLAPGRLQQNTALLAAMGESGNSAANDAIRAVELIVATILVVATIAVIYNSFMISVLERTRQFGIIRTVGATPRQIRRIVYRQASIIGLIGAPLGLSAGLLAVRIVVLIFNSLSTDIGFADVGMSYPPAVLIGGPLLGLLSVFASALLPARAASRVSPLEALLAEGRFVKDRIHTRRSTVLAALFGVSGRMASLNLRRHPGRLAVTVFSIGIGVALFVTFAGFFGVLTAASTNLGSELLRGDITVDVRGSGRPAGGAAPIGADRRQAVAELPGVEELLGLYEVAAYLVLPSELAGGSKDQVDADTADRVRSLTKTAGVVGEVSVLGIERAGIEKLRSRVLSGWRSYEDLKASGGVYIPEGFLEIGDILTVVVGREVHRLPVVGLAENLPGGNYNSGTAVAAIETTRALTGARGYTGFEVDVAPGAKAADLALAIEAVIGSRNDVFAFDLTSVQRSEEQINLQLSILLYGLVVVVGLIGALNIVNTITTNLILRVREFGTLRAVGMSGDQMRAMVRIEAVLYGVWAVLGGGAVGVGLTRLMFNNVTELQAIAWQLPWQSLVGSTVVAVGICLVSAAVPMRRIAAMNIVESIRTVE